MTMQAGGPHGRVFRPRIAGQYRNTPADTQVPYLKTVFTFLGLTDVQFVYAEGLGMGPDAVRNGIASAHEQIEEALAM
jgi:FMN-dependent NADH-azoreductase